VPLKPFSLVTKMVADFVCPALTVEGGGVGPTLKSDTLTSTFSDVVNSGELEEAVTVIVALL
jgi:hypothetical protein